MNVEEVMEKHGFRVSASCAGTASYTRWIKYNGKRAYVTVTDTTGDGLPKTFDDPIRVGTFDLRSGDELEPSRDISSLQTYLAMLQEEQES